MKIVNINLKGKPVKIKDFIRRTPDKPQGHYTTINFNMAYSIIMLYHFQKECSLKCKTSF